MLGRVNHVESSVPLVCVFVYLVLKITEAYLILYSHSKIHVLFIQLLMVRTMESDSDL
jgi:hypothetical protein